MDRIKLGLLGYGNIARGIEANIPHFKDMEISAVFTRRDPSVIDSVYPVYKIERLNSFKDKIDVLILCCGSKGDTPVYGPNALKRFNTVDSFDNHAKIPDYFLKMQSAGKKSGKLGLISCGWDPGLFSLARTMFSAILPLFTCNTFWGKGVSQGHSDAIRGISGVLDARQYTIPAKEALAAARRGFVANPKAKDKHKRVCYVAAEKGADLSRITQEIVTMPDYFAGYDTTVNFLSIEDLRANHSGMPHGGSVIMSGETGGIKDSNKMSGGARQLMELSLKLESNPQFTAAVLLCCTRAVKKLAEKGESGAITMLDVPPALFSNMPYAKILKDLL